MCMIESCSHGALWPRAFTAGAVSARFHGDRVVGRPARHHDWTAVGGKKTPRSALADAVLLLSLPLLAGRRRRSAACPAVRQAVPRRQLLISAPTAALLPSAAVRASSGPTWRPNSLWYVDRPGHYTPVQLGSAASFPEEILRDMDVAIMGEHHNFSADHLLEAEFLRGFAAAHAPGSVGLGLEMVEQQLQPELDRFNSGELSLEELPQVLKWKSRWGWSFKGYLPVFQAAKELGIRCVALNLPTAVQHLVQLEGLSALTPAGKDQYMPDEVGFQASLQLPGFDSYVHDGILPAYDTLLRGGMLGSKDRAAASPADFVTSHLLRDEAMATVVWRCLRDSPTSTKELPASGGLPLGGLKAMVVLVGFIHARFEYGLVHRLRRLCRLRRFRVASESVQVLLRPELAAPVVATLRRGEVFEVSEATPDPTTTATATTATATATATTATTTISQFLELASGRGFVSSSRGTVQAMDPLSSIRVKSVVMNLAVEETLAAEGEDALRLALPVSGLPQSQWPKLADYVWESESAKKHQQQQLSSREGKRQIVTRRISIASRIIFLTVL
ncbi:unnamed protein product [Polarella glacialis]|uniref:Haem-binding uptake Tiki superfamily ChaN domain-containing protein n=1 Tax=Polarella glacialis TaxID=89957 RepID=A0A813K850_POLGL|nr:unnamed protein product [Polarella glacialis]